MSSVKTEMEEKMKVVIPFSKTEVLLTRKPRQLTCCELKIESLHGKYILKVKNSVMKMKKYRR